MTSVSARRGQARLTQVATHLGRTLVCLDFDGTLSPIVDDPDQAAIHPEAPEALRELLPKVLAVAVVTGRPVGQVLELGRLEALLADPASVQGRLEVRGQYGNEHWSSLGRELASPAPPPELVELRELLPAVLGKADLGAAHVEEKGLAIAVHTRRLAEPDEAARRAHDALRPVAERLGLVLEPGRRVVELRAPGMDKGAAVRALIDELAPAAVVFVGDDLGDLAAFEEVERFRADGGWGLLVCSGSSEQRALVEHADLVVDGPDAVVQLLHTLAMGAAAED